MKKTALTVLFALFLFSIPDESVALVSTEIGTGDLIGNDKEEVKLKITGMTCGGCGNHISSALENTKGVIANDVKYPGDTFTISYNPNETSVVEIIKVIEKAGYKAEVFKS
jgi:periplasmic mercuric ion binding protein